MRLACLEHLLDDVRYAVRGLRRSPGFTAAVVLTLGLGIGANAAMFGVVDRLMFRPFPHLHAPDRVHRVYLQVTGRRTVTSSVIPYTRYLDLAREAKGIEVMAAVAERPLAIGTGAATRERPVVGVSGSFFSLFDSKPAAGRFIGPGDDRIPLGGTVAVVGHEFWRSELGAEDVIGRPLAIGTLTFTVVGVAPEGFVGVTETEPPAVFIPITTFPLAAGENKSDDYYTRYNWDWATAIVRRAPGVTVAAAGTQLTGAFKASRAAQRAINPGILPDSIGRPTAIAGAMRTASGPDSGLEARTLLWVAGVAAIVLLIACANVSNLMFARTVGRRREIAVRRALGVSGARLTGLFVTESLLLAMLGAVAGIGIAQWGGFALRRLVLPPATAFGIAGDTRSLLAAAVAALLAGFLTALGPTLLAHRIDPTSTLRSGLGAGTRRSRARAALIVVQGAMSVVLLVGAHLFVRSLERVRSIPLGYEPAPVLMVQTELRGVALDSVETVALRQRLLASARGIPGVIAAARVNSRPFGTNTMRLFVPGVDSVDRLGRFNFQAADPDYFETMGTRIVRGRGLTAADGESGPHVVVVSEAMARALWPEADALGRCLMIAMPAPGSPTPPPCRTIVGIAEDAIHQSMTEDQRLMYYLPIDQIDPSWGRQIFVRVRGDAAAARERVRVGLNAAMPGEGYVTVRLLDDEIARQRRSWQLGATMFVGFGILALLVAAVGLYGTIGYDVTQRMRELGIRIALGARAEQLIRLVMGDGLQLALAGVLLGLAVSVALAPFVEPLLYRQSARDPATYLLVAGILLIVAVIASAVPAARAAGADPNAVLRSD